jgi:hypothetical protein
MATKKTPKLTYVGSPQYVPQTIAATIPSYENSGVRNQGYYKKEIGGGNFEIRAQSTRFISAILTRDGVTVDTTFSRVIPLKNFFCSYIAIDYSLATLASVTLTVYDANKNNPKLATTLFLNNPSNFSIDLTSCPRKFQGDTIILNVSSALTATDIIRISLYGWDED